MERTAVSGPAQTADLPSDDHQGEAGSDMDVAVGPAVVASSTVVGIILLCAIIKLIRKCQRRRQRQAHETNPRALHPVAANPESKDITVHELSGSAQVELDSSPVAELAGTSIVGGDQQILQIKNEC